MTLNDLEGHSPIASLSMCDFSYSYASVDKILSDFASISPSAIAKLLVLSIDLYEKVNIAINVT